MNRDVTLPLVLSGAFAGACLKYMAAPPNIELLLPFVMAAGMLRGSRNGFMAGFSVRMMYDFYLGMPGPWTVYTSLAYGLVGALASFVPAGSNRLRLALWAGALTLAYDAITMSAFGLSFGLPLAALVGPQVPFTALHLAGNCVFVFALLPGICALARRFETWEPGALRTGLIG